MFESLSNRLADVFDALRRRGALSESDVDAALREVRIALLEADVALPVVKDFITQVKERAVGADVVKSVTPGQMVVKIVHDHLIEMLGAESVALNLAAVPPVPTTRRRRRSAVTGWTMTVTVGSTASIMIARIFSLAETMMMPAQEMTTHPETTTAAHQPVTTTATATPVTTTALRPR